MKKGLYLLIATSLCFGACNLMEEKTDSTAKVERVKMHQTFKGIEIDGVADSMVVALEEKGYQHAKLRMVDGKYMLKGKFAGYDDCTILLHHTFEEKIVYEVMVGLPKRESWIDLKQDYEQLKVRLDDKYGKPKQCEEKFYAEKNIVDDEMRFWEVKNGKCKYYAIYDTPHGEVKLEIGHTERIGLSDICWVTISYRDDENYARYRAESDNDL